MNVTAFKEAQEAYARGDYERALEGFSVCTRELDDLSLADKSKFYHLIGNCYIKSGRADKAAEYYRKALNIAPHSRQPALLVNLGTALLNSDQYEEALSAFENALDYPAYTTPYRAYSGIGAARLKLGDLTEAGAAYRDAALDPANPAPSKALVNLGICFMGLGRSADAVTSYETALDFATDDASKSKTLAHLGQAYMAQGRVNKALEAFETATADGNFELPPMARHDYEIAKVLKDKLDKRVPGILDTGFIPPVAAPAVAPLPDFTMPQDLSGELIGEDGIDPFAPKTSDEDYENSEYAHPAASEAESEEVPTLELEKDQTEAQVEEACENTSAEGYDEGQEQLPDEIATTKFDAVTSEMPTANEDVQGEGDEPASSEAVTAAFDSVGDTRPQQPIADSYAPIPVISEEGYDAQQAAIANLSGEDADVLPSPDDTAFFDVTENEINAKGRQDARRARKRRGVGFKIAITFVVICIILAAAVCAAYFFGFGYPTQETVTGQFVTAAINGEDTSEYWASDVDETTRTQSVALLQGVSSCEIDAVDREMSHSKVYVKAKTKEGADIWYEVMFSRDGIGWAVQYVELYFPSQG